MHIYLSGKIRSEDWLSMENGRWAQTISLQLSRTLDKTANGRPCNGMTKLSRWEASCRSTDLLVSYLSHETPRLLLFSPSHRALSTTRFLRGSPTSWLGLLLRIARSIWQLEGRGPQRTSPSDLSLAPSDHLLYLTSSKGRLCRGDT